MGTKVLALRIPEEVYEYFENKTKEEGFKSISDTFKNWVGLDLNDVKFNLKTSKQDLVWQGMIITARDFSETVPLLRQNGIEPIVYGSHQGKNKLKKSLGLVARLIKLVFGVPKFDLAFSLGGVYTSLIATLRRKKSISFSDNDFTTHKFLTYLLSDYFLFPKYLKYQSLQ